MEINFGFDQKKIFIFTITLQIALIALIFSDYLGINYLGIKYLHLLREIIGFFYLTFIPGMIILQLINLKKIDFTRFILFSMGLSIFFAMSSVYLLNEVLLFLNDATPLTTFSILAFFSILIPFLLVASQKLNRYTIFELSINYRFFEKTGFKLIFFTLLLLPILSIFGTYLLNFHDTNLILLILLITIVFHIILFSFLEFPSFYYPFSIFIISISILLMGALRSNHLLGIDIHNEFYVFQSIFNSSKWALLNYSTFDACLSISILPTIYAKIMGMNPEFLFKILYSLFFAFSPLIVYNISKDYLGKSYAFYAAMFFISQSTFFFSYLNCRTSIGLLFFGFSILAILSTDLPIMKKKFLFICFILGCVLSHYATTYLFMWLLLSAFIILEIASKLFKIELKEKFTLEILFLLFSLIVVWYSQLTGAPFYSSINILKTTILNLQGLFDSDTSKGVPALMGSGITEKGIPHKLEFLLTWSIFGLIALGILNMLYRYKYVSFPEITSKKVIFLIKKFETNYLALALGCIIILFSFAILPFLSGSYGIDRTYAFTSIILTPICVIGAITFSDLLKRIKININPHFIILILLIPYFLLVSGFMYNMFGYDRSVLLNSHGEYYDSQYLHDDEVIAIKWMEKNGNTTQVAASDYISALRLTSMGNFHPDFIDKYSINNNITPVNLLYLRYYNVVNKKIIVNNTEWNVDTFENLINVKNKVYDNGGSRVLL